MKLGIKPAGELRSGICRVPGTKGKIGRAEYGSHGLQFGRAAAQAVASVKESGRVKSYHKLGNCCPGSCEKDHCAG